MSGMRSFVAALLLGLLWSGTAAAQCTPTGSLLIQRSLGEIACLGSAAQLKAQINLGGPFGAPVGHTAVLAATTNVLPNNPYYINGTAGVGATLGATSSTTAIIGSPSWTQVFATSGAASAITISAPTADTTLGAVNLTITPSSGTWNVGGSCSITSTQQGV